MNRLELILSEIYNSNDLSDKGSSLRILEQFFVARNKEVYLVLVIESTSFDGNIIGYDYLLYSLSERQYVEKGSRTFADLVSPFPKLEDIQQGGSISFLEKRRLNNLFADMVEEIYDNPKDYKNIWSQYSDYLDNMNKGKSESLQKIYYYFKEENPNVTL